jgi:A/G-specific adenine glycosylase
MEHFHVLPDLRCALCQFFQRRGRDLPWRRTHDPYGILVAEVLLQKTGAAPVEHVWTSFIQRYPNVTALAGASLDDVESLIRPLGLRKRAKNLVGAAQILLEQTGSKVVPDPDLLESLPGVGSYTSAAVLSFAFDISVAVIDVNAARVYTRVGGFSPNTLRQGLAFARVVGSRVVTQDSHIEVNYGVLDLAALVCKLKPLCKTCPVLDLCACGLA